MRAKTLKGVQEQNCRSHCSFRPLHLLSPFPSTQAHSFKPRTNSNPSWPTSTSIFVAQTKAQCSNPFFFLFLFFCFLSPTCPSLPPFFSHAISLFLQPPYLLQSAPFSLLSHHFPLSSPMQTPITPLAHHFPLFPLHVSCMNSPLNTLSTCKSAAKTPCW